MPQGLFPQTLLCEPTPCLGLFLCVSQQKGCWLKWLVE